MQSPVDTPTDDSTTTGGVSVGNKPLLRKAVRVFHVQRGEQIVTTLSL